VSVLLVGSIGLDTLETPFGKKVDVLGGSGIHASVSCSFYSKVSLIGAAGEDFPQEHVDFLNSRGIDTAGLQRIKGKQTFRWDGYYEYDMNQAHTRDTKLNVLAEFKPRINGEQKKLPYVFLANLDPEIQLHAISELDSPKLIAADTMDFWISGKREALVEVVRKVDVMLINEGEIRQFMDTPNIPQAARKLIELGAKSIIVKKGEHGALYFSRDSFFALPSYPQEELKDPTGAGDSFAGGFIGYLAQTNDTSEQNIRKALVCGSVMASFNIEDFSLDRLKSLTHAEIVGRFNEFKGFTHFDEMNKITA